MKILLGLCVFFSVLSCKDSKNKMSQNNDREEIVTKASEDIIQNYSVIGWRSHIAWRAHKITESHTGKITVNSGSLKMSGKEIVSGAFNIDMNTIIVVDLKGKEKEELEKLLKGQIKDKEGYFFNVKENPTATFEILDSYIKNEKTYISGNLTMNGKTNAVDFFTVDFEVFPEDESKIWMISKNFIINRLDWDINYGSKTVFQDLTDALIIRDDLKIRIKILLKKEL